MMFHFTPLFITSLLVALTCVIVTYSLPTGAPICTVGEPAPGDPHRDGRDPQIGTLTSAGFVATLNGVPLDDVTIPTFQVNEEIKVVVTNVVPTQQFKGTLVIVSQPGRTLSNVFSLSDVEKQKLQISIECPKDARDGVTHIDRELKTSVEASMVFTENYVNLFVDVNVVVINKEIFEGGSRFYHTQYRINVEGGTPPPAPVPRRKCGFFGLGLFCPFTGCGFFGRLIYGDDFCN